MTPVTAWRIVLATGGGFAGFLTYELATTLTHTSAYTSSYVIAFCAGAAINYWSTGRLLRRPTSRTPKEPTP